MATEQIRYIKASQVLKLLEDLSIKKYKLYSNFYLGSPRVIEISDVQGFFKLAKSLNQQSHKEHVGAPCFINKFQFKYKGWTVNTEVECGDSGLCAIVSKMEEDGLIR